MTAITLFLCGDVMTGRGIDQILPHPSHPRLHEFSIRDARVYIALAEGINGPLQQPVDFAYIWGDALSVLREFAADVRLINLETSITTSDDYWPGKGIHYRMHPQNISCLTAARINVCALANNHVLDWGYAGLAETLTTLRTAQIKTAGAGATLELATAPAIVDLNEKGRVLVFAMGTESSGIPPNWAAQPQTPGVNRLSDLSNQTIQAIQAQVQQVKRVGDIVVVSIHWGTNWGYKIPYSHIRFAHQLIDQAGVDVIHGHSSHHVRGLEVYHGKLILYGCGDFINDYEGISGYEQYRDDLSLMYFVCLNPTSGQLTALQMIPTQIKHFQIHRADRSDSLWLKEVLNRQGKPFGTQVDLRERSLILKAS
jgi:poly-gamma-glutamate capsule biosynthesis protein CapA/YwtB (metallophosphatase superfamily)